MEFPQKTKNRASNSTPGCISGKNENTSLKRSMRTNVHSSTFYNSQDMKVTQVSINRQMDKEDVIYTYMNITQP